MKKITFKNSKGKKLVGQLYGKNSDKVFIATHGISGEKTEFGKFIKLAKALNNINYDTLLFDFSGSGESEDEFISITTLTEDVNNVIEYCFKRGYLEINLLGFSFGAVPVLRAYKNNLTKIKNIILWAPVTNTYVGPSISDKKMLTSKTGGHISRTVEYPERDRIFFSKKFIEENNSIDTADLLSGIRLPVLVVHGSEDENIPVKNVREAMKYLPEGSKLEIIENANHVFINHRDKVIKITTDWIQKKASLMPPKSGEGV